MAQASQIDGPVPAGGDGDALGVRVYFLVALALVVGVAWRPVEGNPDYWQYREWYLQSPSVREYLNSPWMMLERDPGYFLLTAFTRQVGIPFAAFVLLFSSFWATVKAVQIFRLSSAPLLSLALYACFFYPLHELVQIRAGAATALFLVALPFLVEGRRLAYVGIVLLAATLQLAALVLLPLVLLRSEGVRPRWYLVALLASAAFAASGVRLDFLVQSLAELVVDVRVAFYAAELVNDMPTGTAFNRVSVPELLLAVTLLLRFDEVRKISPYASHVVRIFALAQIAFFLFVTGVPTLGFRLAQLIGAVGVLAWALLWGILRGERLKLAIVGAVGALYLTTTARLFP